MQLFQDITDNVRYHPCIQMSDLKVGLHAFLLHQYLELTANLQPVQSGIIAEKA